MRIRKPKGITKGQLVLVSVLGVFSGVYIWKPVFDDYFGVKRPQITSTTVAAESEKDGEA